MWNSPEYVSGSYLHRLYLSRNTLFSEVHATADKDKVLTLLTEKYNALRDKEDRLLEAYATSFQGSGTAQDGLDIINNLFKGSDTALKQMIAAIKPVLEKGKQLDLKKSEDKEKVINAVVAYIEGQKSKASAELSDELSDMYEDMYNDLMKKINSLVSSSKGDAGLMALEGFIHEDLVYTIYVYNVLRKIETLDDSHRKKFMNWAEDIACIATANGDDRVTTKVGSRFSSYDMTIKVPLNEGLEDIPVQLKAKPKSKTPEIKMVQSMQIENLLGNIGIDDITHRAIKTALINQHFWGTKSYKEEVKEVGKNLDVTPDSNLSSAHPTAIERFDKSQTLKALQPVLPVIENAVFYNLVTGVSEKIDTLLWIVTAPGGYRIMRSSDMLLKMMGLQEREGEGKRSLGKIKGLEDIKSSGKVKVDGNQIADMSVLDYYGQPGQPLSRTEWWTQTEGIVNSAYEKMAITLTFNYTNIP